MLPAPLVPLAGLRFGVEGDVSVVGLGVSVKARRQWGLV